jgi:hypothetical protein
MVIHEALPRGKQSSTRHDCRSPKAEGQMVVHET